MHRFLRRFWANVVDEETGELRVVSEPADDETRRLMHRTIDAVRGDMGSLEFNTAIAALMTLNNRLTQVVGETGHAPEEVARSMVLMLAPLTPHIAEELWERMDGASTVAFESFPEPDPALLVDDVVEVPVQVNGKVRGKILVAPDASEAEYEAAARADEHVVQALAGREVRKVIVVPGRAVNFVVA